jgi:alkylation response protein AidB-like acyl-CoA dehydrogenase
MSMQTNPAGGAATAEQRRMLADSVADFITRGTNLARVRGLRGSAEEYDRAIWTKMAELGWLSILVPEKYGGLGLGLMEMAIVAQGIGRVLVPEPLTASAVLATTALARATNEVLKHAELPRLAAGEVLAAAAWQEEAGSLDAASSRVRATPFEGGYKLNGSKRFVAGAAQADAFLVSASGPEGLMLFWIPRDVAGAVLRQEPLADGRSSGTLLLHDALVTRGQILAAGRAAVDALETALDHARAIAAAELCGVMSRALEMTIDYLKTRVQFGKAIGSFQALQHRAVDLHIHKELSLAVLEDAVTQLDREPDAPLRALIASRVKARCSDAALKITRETIQLHGGIGFTDEHDIGLYLKRALTLAAWLGNASAHRRRYAELALHAG